MPWTPDNNPFRRFRRPPVGGNGRPLNMPGQAQSSNGIPFPTNENTPASFDRTRESIFGPNSSQGMENRMMLENLMRRRMTPPGTSTDHLGLPGISGAGRQLPGPAPEGIGTWKTRTPAAPVEKRQGTWKTWGGESTDNSPVPIDPNEALRAQMMAIMNQPDIPGQWISPYSQEYLDQLGGRLTGAGEQANAGFGAANQELIDAYNKSGAATNQISDTNQAGLGENLANLGLNYQNMDLSKQWDADQAQMNQVAGQNLATDQSFNTKMGGMFQQLGSHYGQMAQEGLLTPKQWQGPQSGISDGERMQVDFLKDQLNRNLDNMDYESAMKMEQEMMNELNGQSTQEMEHLNPLFSQALGSIQNPQVKDAALTAYNIAGGDVPGALKWLTEQMQQNKPGLSTQGIPRASVGNVQNLAGGGNIFQSVAQMLQGANAGNRAKTEQDKVYQEALQILMGISPTITGVPTSRTNVDTARSSSRNGTTFNFPT